MLLGLAGCDGVNPRVATSLNQDAALTGQLPANPLQWKILTSWIDKTDKEHPLMSTLYGNDVAVGYARANAGQAYPAGSELALVTWGQQEDPRWFGGNMPKTAWSVEFVTVTVGANQKPSYAYQKFGGSPLSKVPSQDGAVSDARAAFLLSQRAAVMP
jgi:hypothetical protein